MKTNDDGDVQFGFNSKNIFKKMQFNGKWEIYGSTLFKALQLVFLISNRFVSN